MWTHIQCYLTADKSMAVLTRHNCSLHAGVTTGCGIKPELVLSIKIWKIGLKIDAWTGNPTQGIGAACD